MKSEERINEESYNKFKGNFFIILTSQNGSRVIQKCLKKTTSEIISCIFQEVINNCKLRLSTKSTN